MAYSLRHLVAMNSATLATKFCLSTSARLGLVRVRRVRMESPPTTQSTSAAAPAVSTDSPGEALGHSTESPTNSTWNDAKALIAKEEDFLRFNLGSTDDCRKFFDRHTDKFNCVICNTPLRKNGQANKSYRLKCPSCAKTHSLKGMVLTMRQSSDTATSNGPNEAAKKKIKRRQPPTPCKESNRCYPCLLES